MKKMMMMTGLVAALAVGGTGCMAPLYSGTEVDIAAIHVVKYNNPARPIDNKVDPIKKGVAATHKFLFWFISVGDASLDAAMRDGDIRQIHHVDTDYINFLGLYQRKAIIVYGD